MSDMSLQQACDCLGVTPEDGLLKIRLAYQELRGIYAEDSLASYALFEPEERQQRLERIEEAYRVVTRELTVVTGNRPPAKQPQVVADHSPDAQTVPEEMAEAPGLCLRLARERAGMTLQDIAHHTKVSASQFDAIESQRLNHLPAPVYLRGFVEQFAALVGMPDPRQAAESYLAWWRRQGED